MFFPPFLLAEEIMLDKESKSFNFRLNSALMVELLADSGARLRHA